MSYVQVIQKAVPSVPVVQQADSVVVVQRPGNVSVNGSPVLVQARWGQIQGTLSNQTDLNAALNTLQLEITTLNSDVVQLNSEVNTLNSEVNTLNSDLASLNSEVEALELEVANKISKDGSTTTTDLIPFEEGLSAGSGFALDSEGKLTADWDVGGVFSITGINALGVIGNAIFQNNVTIYSNKSLLFGNSGNTYLIDADSLGDGALRFRVGSGTTNRADFQFKVMIPDGATGADNLALYFSQDTDTGIYRSATNVLMLQAAGADKFSVGGVNNISYQRLRPSTDDAIELGSSSIRWQYLYGVNISDGTKTIAIGNLANLKANETVEGNWILALSEGRLGFFGTSPIAKATVSGSRATGAALISLLTTLANYGLITDSTTA